MSNFVQLLGHYGSDETHACSAWTSTSRELTGDKVARIPGLLKMLADKGHHTPFEKSGLHFLVRSDIASHIHLLKHRIGVSINAESGRYKELKEDKTYIPGDWPPVWTDILTEYIKKGDQLYHVCLADLVNNHGFSRARAKESARYFKTYASQIDCDIMFNWRSFYHFLGLRNKPEAQKEIRDIAASMLVLVKNIEGDPFKHTIEAFDL